MFRGSFGGRGGGWGVSCWIFQRENMSFLCHLLVKDKIFRTFVLHLKDLDLVYSIICCNCQFLFNLFTCQNWKVKNLIFPSIRKFMAFVELVNHLISVTVQGTTGFTPFTVVFSLFHWFAPVLVCIKRIKLVYAVSYAGVCVCVYLYTHEYSSESLVGMTQ